MLLEGGGLQVGCRVKLVIPSQPVGRIQGERGCIEVELLDEGEGALGRTDFSGGRRESR
jgi:hypothetical protein